MGLFDNFPYTNFHELNLMWILEALKEIQTTTEQFVAINSLKYADPIQWNITSQYEKNTIVIDPQTGTAYISVQAVPMGVALTNEDYWTVVFDLGSFVTKAAKNFTTRWEEETTLTATFSSEIGQWLVWGDTLYRAAVNITAGDAYTIDSNIIRITIEEIKDEIYSTFNGMIGNLADLNTEDKNNLVAAINEVTEVVANKIGSLGDLETEDKSNLVAAINEVLDDITNEVTARTEADSALQTAIINEVTARTEADSTLQLSVNENTKNITDIENDYTILIGDSYAVNFTGHRDNPWILQLRDYIGTNNCYVYRASSIGFATGATPTEWAAGIETSKVIETNNFLWCLIQAYNAITDKEKVRKIVVCGGGNDNPYVVSYIYPAIEYFCTRAKEMFPNARIYIGYIFNSVNVAATDIKATMRKTLVAYTRCQNYGAIYLSGVENLLRDYDLMDTEDVEGARGTHPNQNGCDVLFKGIMNALYQGGVALYRTHTNINYTSINQLFVNPTLTNVATEWQKDNMIAIKINTARYQLSEATSWATNTAISIGSLTKKYIIGDYSTVLGIETPFRYTNTDNESVLAVGYFYINRNCNLILVTREAVTNATSIVVPTLMMWFDTMTA